MSYYFGFLTLGIFISLIFWMIFFTLGFFGKNQILSNSISAFIIVASLFVINLLAIYNFEKGIKIRTYDIESDKITKAYKILQVGDIQYGSVSQKYMENVFELAAKQNPDMILFVGDLIDFDFYKEEDFNFLQNISIPIYFINGNHEFYHGKDRIASYLDKLNHVKILNNERAAYNKEIDIIGIDYCTSENQLTNRLEKISLENDKFSILLYHEPKAVEIGVKKGFDLMLYGHTHGGQIFPLTQIVDLTYQYGNGFYRNDDTIIYTTTGAGLWGPKMRLGTENEIVVFNLKGKKSEELTINMTAID